MSRRKRIKNPGFSGGTPVAEWAEMPIINYEEATYMSLQPNNSLSQTIRRIHENQVAGRLSKDGEHKKCNKCQIWKGMDKFSKNTGACKECQMLEYYRKKHGDLVGLPECSYCGEPTIGSPYCSEQCRLSLEAIALDFMPPDLKKKALEPKIIHEGVTPILVKYPNGKLIRVVYTTLKKEDWETKDGYGIPKRAYDFIEFEGEVPVYVKKASQQLWEYAIWFRDGTGKFCPLCKQYKTRDSFYPKRINGVRPGHRIKAVMSRCKQCISRTQKANYVSQTTAGPCVWCHARRTELIDDDFCSERCKYIYMRLKHDIEGVYGGEAETDKDWLQKAKSSHQLLVDKYSNQATKNFGSTSRTVDYIGIRRAKKVKSV